MTQRIEINVPFQGFYESIHMAAIEDALERHDEDTGDNQQENFSMSAEKMREYVKNYLTRLSSLLPCEDNFTDMRVSSPREYNFSTDTIIASLDIATLRKVMDEVKKLNAEGFRQRVKVELEPRSGFAPFYSNDLNDWSTDLSLWAAPQLELLIRFYLEEEHGESWEDGIVGDMNGNGECDLMD